MENKPRSPSEYMGPHPYTGQVRRPRTANGNTRVRSRAVYAESSGNRYIPRRSMDNECGDDEAAEGALGLITVEPGGLRRIDRIHRRKPFVYLKVFGISRIKLFDTSMTQCGGQNEIEDQFTPGRVLKMGSYHPEQFHIPGATSPTAAVTIISNNIGCLFLPPKAGDRTPPGFEAVDRVRSKPDRR